VDPSVAAAAASAQQAHLAGGQAQGQGAGGGEGGAGAADFVSPPAVPRRGFSVGAGRREREIFIDNLLVQIHFIIEMIWCTGLAPWKFEFALPDSLQSTFLECW